MNCQNRVKRCQLLDKYQCNQMRSWQIIHPNKSSSSKDSRQEGSGYGNNPILSKIIVSGKPRELSQMSEHAQSSQFIYNSQTHAESSQAFSHPDSCSSSATSSRKGLLDSKLATGGPISQHPPSPESWVNKYELEYRRLTKNLSDCFNIAGQATDKNLQSKRNGWKKVAVSVILQHSMQNIKQFETTTINLVNPKNNKNRKKMKSTERQEQCSSMQFSGNIYRLIQYELEKISGPPFIRKSMRQEYLNQATESSHRFKLIYGKQESEEETQKVSFWKNRDLIKQKQLSGKFVELNAQQIRMRAIKQDELPKMNTIINWRRSTQQLVACKFYSSLPSVLGVDLSLTNFGPSTQIVRLRTWQELTNWVDQRMLNFTCAIETACKCNSKSSVFEKMRAVAFASTLAENYKKLGFKLETNYSTTKLKWMQQFRTVAMEHFATAECLTLKQDHEFQKIEQQMQVLQDKLLKHQQRGVAARISGQMIYEAEQKITLLRKTKQFWVKTALRIGKERKIQCPKNNQAGDCEKKPSKSKIQIIKKIKNTDQHLCVPASRSYSHLGLTKSQICDDPKLKHNLQGLEDSNLPNNRSRKSIREKKRQQLNNYINELCLSSHSSGHQGPRNTYPESTHCRPDKFIKYTKYPIKFDECIEFQPHSSCAIIYNTTQIITKQLTLKFIKDRRKYSVNAVILRISPNGLAESGDEQKKAMKILQILSCLGANVRVERALPYRFLEETNDVGAQIIAFLLRESIQVIWQRLQN